LHWNHDSFLLQALSHFDARFVIHPSSNPFYEVKLPQT
jgi:hypothetical protein